MSQDKTRQGTYTVHWKLYSLVEGINNDLYRPAHGTIDSLHDTNEILDLLKDFAVEMFDYRMIMKLLFPVNLSVS